MVSVRRTLTAITPEDASGAGAPKVYGYGRRWIERVSGKSTRTVERAIAAGDFDPACPVSTVAWCAVQRGEVRAGDAILSALAPQMDRD